MKGYINFILTIIFLISIVIYLTFQKNFIVCTFLPSFIIAIVQILMTVNIVDALLDIDRKKKQEKYIKIAYLKITPAIRDLSENAQR